MNNPSHQTVKDDFCQETRPRSCSIVIFGASGDLTHRKLIPSLFNLFSRDLMPENFFILGCARSPMEDEEFRRSLEEAILRKKSNPPLHSKEKIAKFLSRCFYQTGNYQEQEFYEKIAVRIEDLNSRFNTKASGIFYMATPPDLYTPITSYLAQANLIKKSEDNPPLHRIVVEKPFGLDLQSALNLNDHLITILSEKQIYRMDHYLGKDTVQNILIFRFANSIFEPIWNRSFIDNIQITVSESLGVGHRADYYERAGLLRDMFQNHMLQMLSLVAMEAPASFEADRIRDEKVKLLRSIRPFTQENIRHCFIRGQYAEGEIEGEKVPAYRQEKGVASDSQTETFVAAKLMIDNWRWQGVPFFLRSGKRLEKHISEIAINFKAVPFSLFSHIPACDLTPNSLILNVQPREGVALRIQAKQPGAKLCMSSIHLSFDYREIFGQKPPEAYERLLLDCMAADQSLFIREDDIRESWSLFTPVLEEWEKNSDKNPLFPYKSGGWGPKEADSLLKHDHCKWREIE